GQGTKGSRTTVLVATGAVVVMWALAYAWVRRHAGLELPHGIERDPTILSASPATRLGWALWNSRRATWSLPSGRAHGLAAAVFGVALAAAVLAISRQPAARSRWRTVRGAVAWGGAW